MNNPTTTWAEAGYGLRPAGLALLGFAIIDFSLAPLMEFTGSQSWSTLVPCALLGSVLAQATLLAAYLVWGQGQFWERLMIHWGIALLLWCVWLAGYAWMLDFGRSGNLDKGVTGLLLPLPLMSLALQTPLWLTRGFGLRLYHPAGGPPAKPWSIADLLIGTTVLAVSLSAILADQSSTSPSIRSIASAVAIGLSIGTALSLPICLAMLRIRHVRIGLLVAAIYSLVLVTFSSVLVISIGGAANIGIWPTAALAVGQASSVAIVAGCLAIARRHGWRLMTDREAASTRLEAAAQPAA